MVKIPLFVILSSITLYLLTAEIVQDNADWDEVLQDASFWDEVLSAEISCCPSHAGSEADCLAESYSNCVWLPADDPIVLNTPSGSQCLGVTYVECKRPNPTGCCGPCCGCPPETPAPLGPGETPSPFTQPLPPVCGPAPVVTPAPVTPAPVTPAPVTPAPNTPAPVTPAPVTPAPITPAPVTTTTEEDIYKCERGVNYLFEGQSCMISGDPHTIMYNGAHHDLQGIPWIDFGYGTQTIYKNQFFYLHPCDGAHLPHIPIKVLGTHYKWGERTVSGIDYMTIILTDDNGDEYYLFFSSAIHQYGIGGVGGISTNYDDNVANGKTMLTFADRQTYNIGNRFKVFYNEAPDERIKVTVTVDDTDTFRMFMAVQTSFVLGRYRMHYVQMDVPSSMKCYACGLCGDFKTRLIGDPEPLEKIEGCDGTVYDFRPGLDPTDNPESYDQDGWSWEYNYVMNTCSSYDITDNIPDGVELKEVCFARVKDDVEAECLKQRQENADCCKSIGGTFCFDLLRNCKVDACAQVEQNGENLEEEVTKVMTDVIQTVCDDSELYENIGDAPLSILQCPAGSVQATGVGGLFNDILGCGLTKCAARYSSESIEECQLECENNADCMAFSWAPVDGDQNNLDENVCTLYDGDTPTRTHGPNQIFCRLETITCSLEIYAVGRDDTVVSLSQNGGVTFTEIQENIGWHHLITTKISGISPNTQLKYKTTVTGEKPGGFGATVYLITDQRDRMDTFVTDNPLTTFTITDTDARGNDQYILFGANKELSTYWNTDTYPQMDDGTYINKIGIGDYTEYTIDFNDYKKRLEGLGCFDKRIVGGEDEKEMDVVHNGIIMEGSIDESNHIGLMIGVCSVFLACFVGLYYRNRNVDKYEPLIESHEDINPFRKYSLYTV